ncbi:hypothetical protein BC833DRAFT_575832 [Globomyces pollinis-pini]|nr:hypothetical protein BC833DRAFT_575832 [Globomyces pollinis-pini]
MLCYQGPVILCEMSPENDNWGMCGNTKNCINHQSIPNMESMVNIYNGLQPSKPTKVKKPMNSFFIYRREMRQRIIEMYGVNKSQDISKVAGECWALEPTEVKQHFQNLALIHQLEKEEAEQKQKAEMHRRYHSSPVSMPSYQLDSAMMYSNSLPSFDSPLTSINTTLKNEQMNYSPISSSCPTGKFDYHLNSSKSIESFNSDTSTIIESQHGESLPSSCSIQSSASSISYESPMTFQKLDLSELTPKSTYNYLPPPQLSPFEFENIDGIYNFDSLLSSLIKSETGFDIMS